MKLLLQALKLCFWALPAQRLCTVAGLGLMAYAALWLAPQGSREVLLWATNGLTVLFLPPIVAGGPLLRALAAQRAVALAPHGRLHLLAVCIAIALLFAVAKSTYLFVLFGWLANPWQSPFAAWLSDVNGGFAFASLWMMASFAASRSLLATLTVLLVVLGGSLLMTRLDLPLPDQWLPGGGLSFILLCWIVFGTWFLRARRIAHSAWTSRRVEDEAVVTQADTGGIGAHPTRSKALERLLLGGRGTGRLVLQFLLALGLLQVILALIHRFSDAAPEQVAPFQYFGLALVLPVMGAISWLVAARLRSLWLTCRGSRAELFALGEGTLLRLAAGLALVAGAFFVALWRLSPLASASPAGLLCLGLGSVAGAVLLPAYAALNRSGVAALAALVVAVVTLEPTYMDTFVYGGPAGSPWRLALLAVAIVALRGLARRRWLHADMPRAAATAPAF